MSINLSYLKYFFDAVMNKSISAAARKNFVSQSAISQGIAKLEASLKVKLTTHERQKFRLTEEGEVVFREAKNLFNAVDGLKDKLSELKGEVAGEIKFACTNTLAQCFLPSAYIKMKKKYPGVDLHFHRGSLNFIHDALRNEKVNFALALESVEFDQYEQESLSKGSFRLYKHKKSTRDEGIMVDHIENYEVIELRKRYKERYGKNLEVLEALSGWTLVLTFIQMGYGMGYLPEFMIKEQKDIKEVKLDIPLIQYSICAVRRKGATLTRAEKAFLEILKTVQ